MKAIANTPLGQGIFGSAALLLVGTLGLAHAVENQLHSARCGTDLVKLGDSRATLLAHCGRPLDTVSAGRGAKEYYFRRSRSGPTTIFRIQQGRITEIRQVRRL